jgi:DNA primase
MLSERTIEQIRSVQLSQVIGNYAHLKKKGANYTACCPFHDEKTASFSVNDVKEIYKCFGCGAGGKTAITFVMEKEKFSFIDACKKIADLCGITLEYEQREQTEQYKEKISAQQQQENVINYAVSEYTKKLQELDDDHPAMQWLYSLGLHKDDIVSWQFGWAGSEWRYMAQQVVNKTWYEPAMKLGIIKKSEKDESTYDGYRSRVIIPIKDRNGRNIGIAGRYIKLDDKDASQIPKWINTSESELYNKSAVLFGLSQATKGIKEKGCAMITEGYMDVINPHRIGADNTVATGGTAFTKEQMKLLKKYTNHIVFWRDNDAAGEKSWHKSLPEALREGFKVDLMIYDAKDPDLFVQSLDSYNKAAAWSFPQVVDAVHHRCTQIWRDAQEIHEKAAAKRSILDILTNIKDDILRNNYIDVFSGLFKWKAGDTKKEFAAILDTVSFDEDAVEDESAIKFASWMSEEQKEECLKMGYVSVNRKEKNGKPMVGYYSFSSTGKTEITNFTIKPLFHVYAGTDSRFLLQIYNGWRSAVLDMPSKIIPSPEQFQGYTVSEGNFIIFGSKPQWLRIASELLQQFPRCIEITEYGWQRHGFFAYVDKVFIPSSGLKDVDNWGIIKHNDENFLIPPSSEAYRQLNKTGKDPYENIRYLTYKECKINFETWAKQMHLVYGQKGIVGVAYAILTLFRDIVFEVDNNCPHLYGFGEPSSGKSKWAESISALFYYKRAAYNLNSGTDAAFFTYMSVYVNCPAHLNEFDIEVVKPEWFQAIKGVFDGESRQRMKIEGGKKSVEIMKVESTIILTGQKLVTADDNSVVTRSIIEPFSTQQYTDEESKQYIQLKQWETEGMNSILPEILKFRAEFEKHHKEQFNSQLSEWRKTRAEARELNNRILGNFSHLLTAYTIVSKFITLPQSVDDFKEYCYSQAVKWSQFIRSSDTLSEFWRTLEFLVNQNDVVEGWDFIVTEEVMVKVRVDRENQKDHHFTQPTKVLFLRLNNIHKLFQTAYRSRTGKEAMNMENLLHYFSSRKYYVGAIKQKKFIRVYWENVMNDNKVESVRKFEDKTTSCYAFVYDDLQIDIAREASEVNMMVQPATAEPSQPEPDPTLPF